MLKISTDNHNKHGADAIVSDYEMERIIKLLQKWEVSIKNPFAPNHILEPTTKIGDLQNTVIGGSV